MDVPTSKWLDEIMNDEEREFAEADKLLKESPAAA
jgi:hypothetical protein